MRTSIGCGIIIFFILTGCAHDEYNTRVAKNNVSMLAAYSDGLAKQTTEGGRLALSMVYAMGVGRGDLVRDDTILDYMRGLLPWATLGLGLYAVGGAGDERSMNAGRDIYIDSSSSTTGQDWFNTGQDGSFDYVPELQTCYSPSGTLTPCN